MNVRRLGKVTAALAALVAVGVFASPANAQPGQTSNCPSYDGKFTVSPAPQGWASGPAPGITVSGDSTSVTVNVAAGYTLTRFCYKISGGGGTTSKNVPITPGSFTIDKTNTGNGIRHVSFDVQAPPCPVGNAMIPTHSLAFTGSGVTLQAIATFSIAPGCEDVPVSLATYLLAGPGFTLPQIKVASTGGLFDAGGPYTLRINLCFKCGFFQADLVVGKVLHFLTANSLYLDRKLEWEIAGQRCIYHHWRAE